MSKINKIIELKTLLDSGLITQTDFDRLKKQIFEETENASSVSSEISPSEIVENVQNTSLGYSNEINSTKRCPQCGSDNPIENSDCKICKSDNVLNEKNAEPHKEINYRKKKSKLIIISLIGLALLLFAFLFYKKNSTSQNNENTIDTIIDTTSTIPDNISPPSYQDNSSDTLSFQNETNSVDYSSTDENQNYDNNDFGSNSQENVDEDNNIYNTANIEVKPDFPGGIGNFYKYIGKNFKVPEEEGINGKVFVTFVVEKDGSLTDIKVIKDIGYGTGREAIRVLQSCPRWIPAQQNGKKVRVIYSLPITINSAE